MTTSATYQKAGVDIDAGNQLVERIKPLAQATSRTGTIDGLGGFGALFDLSKVGYKDPVLVSATDGVGTKLKIAQAADRHDTVGIDLVAMCVNDLLVQGAEPLFFLDYFATGKLSVDVAEQVVKGIAEGCKQAGCALIGGETAEMPGMYNAGEYDLAGFGVGAVERDKILPKDNIVVGDALLGLASSGLHSNGFSLVRHIMEEQGFEVSSEAPFAPGQTFADVLLTPTRIYVKTCLEALHVFGNDIRGFSHITGGGLPENLPRALPDTLAAEIKMSNWKIPQIFDWFKTAGAVPIDDYLRTFNCGIGMVMIVSADVVDGVKAVLEAEGETVYTLGSVVERTSEHGVVLRG